MCGRVVVVIFRREQRLQQKYISHQASIVSMLILTKVLIPSIFAATHPYFVSAVKVWLPFKPRLSSPFFFFFVTFNCRLFIFRKVWHRCHTGGKTAYECLIGTAEAVNFPSIIPARLQPLPPESQQVLVIPDADVLNSSLHPRSCYLPPKTTKKICLRHRQWQDK